MTPVVEVREVSELDLEQATLSGQEDFGFSTDATYSIIKQGLTQCLETRTYVIGGEAVCIMGLMSDCLLGEKCHIWMVSLPAVERHRIAFVRHVPKLLKALPYGSVTCLCDPLFVRTVRWLSWEGFAKVDQVEIAGRMFDLMERKL